MLVHLDDLARRDDLDVRRQLPGGVLADARRIADEQDVVLGMGASVIERARDDLGGAMVAAHRVDGEADPAGRGAHARHSTVRRACLPSGP